VKRLALVAAILGTLGFAGQAMAATNYKVYLGQQGPSPAGVPKSAFLNQFLPSKLIVNAGDSVTFSSATFHTVTYAPKPAGLFMPDPAKGTYDQLLDAASSPFYFSTLPKFIYNPAAFGPYGPKAISGKTPASSGVLSPPGRKPVTATYGFPAPGVYHLFCQVHPGMKATVVVKPAATPVPATPAQVQAQALTQTAAAFAKAKALAAAAKAPANTVLMGVGGTSTLLGYFPSKLSVKAGTTVTFVNKSPSEVHNITFGPKKYILGLAKKTDLLPTGPGSPNQVAPFLLYGSEPKGQYNYDGTNHGNGFFATPLTTGTPGVPLPHASKVTFTKAGTYHYFCWIHGPDMSGTIVVTP
jgi:plastocyanin